MLNRSSAIVSQQGCNLEKTTPVQNVGVFTTGIDGRICSDDGWNSAQYAWQSRECSRAHGHLVRVFTSFRLCPKLGIEFILPVTAKSSNPRSNDFRHTKIMAGGACFHYFTISAFLSLDAALVSLWLGTISVLSRQILV